MLKNMPLFYAKKMTLFYRIIIFVHLETNIVLETYINLPSMDFLVKISKSATSQPILSIIILLF